MAKGRLFAAVAAAVFTTLALAGTVSAQYPTPKGSLVCTTTVDVSIGKSTVTATLRDSAGNPVSGQTVTFTITSGKGTLSSNTATTNGSGAASVELHGAENTSVSAVYDGLECRAVAQVLGSTFRPPATGDAGLLGTNSNSNGVILALDLAVMALTGAGVLVLRQRRLATEKTR